VHDLVILINQQQVRFTGIGGRLYSLSVFSDHHSPYEIMWLTSSKLDLFSFFSDPNDEDVEADRLRDEFIDE
jgi:hypothetical protein